MARDHGFHPARIIRVIQETPDTRTYVLDAAFGYRAGQFLTFRVGGTLRSYSMSSCPDTDPELMTTVKRVPGGVVSNWMHDNLRPGDTVEVTTPAGVFCLREAARDACPLIAFAGGSGITPIISLAKNALATTGRRVRILTANSGPESVIFAAALAELAARYPGRLDVRHHLDRDRGFVTAGEVHEFVGGDRGADFYLCGPPPFIDLVENALVAGGADPEQILVERFGTDASGAGFAVGAEPAEAGGTITIVLDRDRRTVARHAGETLLESARRAGLVPPFSCEAGNCATCIAQVTEGEVKMRVNNALDADEVADGWVLTCQGEPATPNVTVVYD
jgi:ferredoxin-NADP reductase